MADPVSIKLPIADQLGDIVAEAGTDQCLTAPNEASKVTLDSSASASLDGELSKAVWHVSNARGCEYVAGTTVTVRLPKGTHDITVEVEIRSNLVIAPPGQHQRRTACRRGSVHERDGH